MCQSRRNADTHWPNATVVTPSSNPTVVQSVSELPLTAILHVSLARPENKSRLLLFLPPCVDA